METSLTNPLTSDRGLNLDVVTVLQATALAAWAHRRQTRKYSAIPYINHPLRVSRQASKAGLSLDAVIAALLHDVPEDTVVTLADLHAAGYTDRVLDLVSRLTKRMPTALARPEDVQAYYDGIKTDPEAAALKVLDRTDNLQDMVDLLANTVLLSTMREIVSWASSYCAKSKRCVTPLLAVLQTPSWVAEAYTETLETVHAQASR